MTPTAKRSGFVSCLAPWAGGKRTLAPQIVELLGQHDAYLEPFVGGCSILPRKPRSGLEFVNDANKFLMNVLRCARDHGQAMAAVLRTIPFSKGTFTTAVDAVRAAKDVPEVPIEAIRLAVQQLVAWWMGPNGLAGTTQRAWFAMRHTATGGDPGVRWSSFLNSFPVIVERLQGVETINMDFRPFLQRFGKDRHGTVIYSDSPYLSKSFKYAVDFDGFGTHRELAAILNGYRKSRVVVSYYDERDDGLFGGGSLLDELYPVDRWERHQVRVSKSSANARRGAMKTEAVEILLVNRT
jgi:DNA adenine methylase